MKQDWAPGVGLSTFSNFTIMTKLTIDDKKKVCRYILHNTEVNGIVEEKHSRFLIKEVFNDLGIDHNDFDSYHIEVRLSPSFRKDKKFYVVKTDGSEICVSFQKYLAKEQLNRKSYE